MVVKPATTVLQWSQPILPHSPSTRGCSSPCSSSKRAVALTHVRRLHRSSLFGATPQPSSRLHRSWSTEFPKSKPRSIRRSCSASLDSFSDEEFSKKIQELALRFQLAADDDRPDSESEAEPEAEAEAGSHGGGRFEESEIHSLMLEDWSGSEIITASIERRANSVELPVSLRMIKRKMQWQESFREVGESAYCSVKKAFSSMVFIIRELHSHSLQMRGFLFYEDLQGILERVHKEMHASFVWLFQQVFSHTPTLMVYVMILLANFTVYSLSHNPAIAAMSSPPLITETVSEAAHGKFESSAVKTFSVSSSSGKRTASVGGGIGGGGGGARPVASETDGDGGVERTAEELALWNSIVEEAANMEGLPVLESETVRSFVSPVSAKIESDEGYEEYFKTEIVYQMGVARDPNNSMLLANYAEFLYLVAHDYDRAEVYFKKATNVSPPDPETHKKYATFLWKAKNELWAAEESFLEALNAEPDNSYYAASYANFLWNTGGDETCFPLSDDAPTTQDS